MVGAPAREVPGRELDTLDPCARELREQPVERGARHEAIVLPAQREHAARIRRHRGFEFDCGTIGTIAAFHAAARPVADHAARLATGEAHAPAGEMADQCGKAAEPREHQAHERPLPARERAPVRRAARDDRDPGIVVGPRCSDERRELCAEAVATDGPRHGREFAAQRSEARRNVALDQLDVTPVGTTSRAHAGRAAAAQLVHRDEHAARGERARERAVMARRHAHRGHEQQAGTRGGGRLGDEHAEARAVAGVYVELARGSHFRAVATQYSGAASIIPRLRFRPPTPTMKFLDRLRKPEWDSRDPERRARAVADAPEAELASRLVDFARSDDSALVRRAAVRRLRDLALLGDRLRTDSDEGVRAAARERLKAVLVDASLASVAERERVLAVEDDADLLAHAASRAPEAAVRRAALERITRPALLLERCQKDPDVELRLWLLGRIESPAALERLADAARLGDKRLARAARDRLQALRIAARDPATLKARALAICDELDALRRELPADAAARAAALNAEWQAWRDVIGPELAQRVEGYERTLRDTLSPRPREVAPVVVEAEAEPEPVVVAEPVAADPARIALVDELEQASAIDARGLARWRRRWADAPGASDAALDARLRGVESAIAARHAEEAQAAQARVRELDAVLDTLEAAVERGASGEAQSAFAQADALRAQGAPATPAQRARLDAASTALGKLTQWQRWSGNKVRARICDDLAALPAAGLHPDAVATKVREAQAEWARIAATEGEAPGESGLDKRFRALCHRALAPTRAYFEKRGELRTQRTTELEAFLAEPAATDPRQLGVARRRTTEWLRRLEEIDPRRRGELGRKLREQLDRLGEARDAASESARGARHKLLANLRRALAHTTLEDALARIDEARTAWRSLPRASGADAAALQKEFDAVVAPFQAQVGEAQAAAQQARSDYASGVDAILAELAALRDDPEALAHAEPRIAAATAKFRALVPPPSEERRDARDSRDGRDRRPPRRDDRGGRGGRDDRPQREPRAAARPREREFDAAIERVREAQVAALRERERSARASVRAAADWLAQQESSALSGAALDADALRAGFDALALSAPDRALLVARFEQLAALDAAGLQAAAEGNRAIAAEIVVQAEWLAGIDSPAAWRELRRAYQVRRLAQRLEGGAAPDPQVESRELLAEWLALGPIPADERRDFQSRLDAALSGFALL